jgi:succinate dehydrogenase/fumarate reductase flavoprotein subunit
MPSPKKFYVMSHPIEKQQVKRWSWETKPDPIPEAQISETREYDAVIIGGGISGLATGARAAQLGLDIVVLEKGNGFTAHGGHVASVGSSIQRANGVHIDGAQFARDWMHICGSRVNEDLLWLYINRSEEAFEWIMELGGDEVYAELYGGYYKGKNFAEYPGTHFMFSKPDSKKWKGNGALLMCRILDDTIASCGSRVIRGTQAMRLEKEDGRVTAVLAKNKDGGIVRYKGKRGTVLATGDIGGDPEMLEAFCPWGLVPKRSAYWPVGGNLGEGHKMGYWVGGAFENAPWALSLHMTAYAGFMNFFLHVNRQGKRFMNEDTWMGAKSARVLMQPGGDYAFSVFDSKWFEEAKNGAPYHGGQAADPGFRQYGEPWDSENNDLPKGIETNIKDGHAYRADTLDELASWMEVPLDVFKATINRYNEIYRQGRDTDYGKRPELLTSIDKPPYYAVMFGPALLNVFGGLLTDTQLRVLDINQKPVGGLLAVGMIAGGLYGVDYPLLFNGNSHGRCLTWGRVAAETLAADGA